VSLATMTPHKIELDVQHSTPLLAQMRARLIEASV